MYFSETIKTRRGVAKYAEELTTWKAFKEWRRIVHKVKAARKSGAEVEAMRTASGYVATIKKPGQLERYTLTR